MESPFMLLLLLNTLTDVASSSASPTWEPTEVCSDTACYFLGQSARGFDEARSECEAFNATLATIAGPAENARVQDVCGARSCWLGLFELPDSEEWIWADGTVLSTPGAAGYTNWRSGEPNNWAGVDETAAMMNLVHPSFDTITTGEWYDANEAEDSYQWAVCERSIVSPAPSPTSAPSQSSNPTSSPSPTITAPCARPVTEVALYSASSCAGDTATLRHDDHLCQRLLPDNIWLNDRVYSVRGTAGMVVTLHMHCNAGSQVMHTLTLTGSCQNLASAQNVISYVTFLTSADELGCVPAPAVLVSSSASASASSQPEPSASAHASPSPSAHASPSLSANASPSPSANASPPPSANASPSPTGSLSRPPTPAAQPAQPPTPTPTPVLAVTDAASCDGLRWEGEDNVTDHLGADWTPVDGVAIGGVHCNIRRFNCGHGSICPVRPMRAQPRGGGGGGGILRVYAREIVIDGHLSADAAGQPGGAIPPYQGHHDGLPGAGGVAGGGGGQGECASYGAPGGGGGHFTAGGAAARSPVCGGLGGIAFGNASDWPRGMTAGGGGGSGGNDNVVHDNPLGGYGGAGGGIIALIADSVVVTGEVSARGQNGQGDGTSADQPCAAQSHCAGVGPTCQGMGACNAQSTTCFWDYAGPGGGGAGGSVYISTITADIPAGSVAYGGGLGGSGACSSHRMAPNGVEVAGDGGEGAFVLNLRPAGASASASASPAAEPTASVDTGLCGTGLQCRDFVAAYPCDATYAEAVEAGDCLPGLALDNLTLASGCPEECAAMAAVSASTSPSATATASVSRTASSSVSVSSSMSASVSALLTASIPASVSATVSTSVTTSRSTSPSTPQSVTATVSPSTSLSASCSVSPSGLASPSGSASATASASVTATASAMPSDPASKSVSPSGSASASVTLSGSTSLTASPSHTATALPSATPSVSPSITASLSASPSGSVSPSGPASSSVSPSGSASASATPSGSTSPTALPSHTATALPSVAPSMSPSITSSLSASPSGSISPSGSASLSVSPSGSASASATPSGSTSPTASPSHTATALPSVTPSVSPIITSSLSASPSGSVSPSGSASLSVTLSASPSATSSPSASLPGSVTPSGSATPSVSASPLAELSASRSAAASTTAAVPPSATTTAATTTAAPPSAAPTISSSALPACAGASGLSSVALTFNVVAPFGPNEATSGTANGGHMVAAVDLLSCGEATLLSVEQDPTNGSAMGRKGARAQQKQQQPADGPGPERGAGAGGTLAVSMRVRNLDNSRSSALADADMLLAAINSQLPMGNRLSSLSGIALAPLPQSDDIGDADSQGPPSVGEDGGATGREDAESDGSEGQTAVIGMAAGGAAAAAAAAMAVVVTRKGRVKRLKFKKQSLQHVPTAAAGGAAGGDAHGGGHIFRVPSFKSFGQRQSTTLARPMDELRMERDDNDGDEYAYGATAVHRVLAGASATEAETPLDMALSELEDDELNFAVDLRLPVPQVAAPPVLASMFGGRGDDDGAGVGLSMGSLGGSTAAADRLAIMSAATSASAWADESTGTADEGHGGFLQQQQQAGAPGAAWQARQRGMAPLRLPSPKKSMRLSASVEQTVVNHTAELFEMLDPHALDAIADDSLSAYLHVSRREAAILISEIKVTLHGRRTAGPLTRDEFRRALRLAAEAGMGGGGATSAVTVDDVPAGALRQYRRIFDEIDVEQRGWITLQQLGGDGGGGGGLDGLGDLLQSGGQAVGQAGAFSFSNFATLLHRAETNSAGRAMNRLLEDTVEGRELVSAVRRSISEERELAARAARHGSAAPARVDPADVPPLALELWASARPDAKTGAAGVDAVREALVAASSAGELLASEDELLTLILHINQAATAGCISFDGFWRAMEPLVEDGDDVTGLVAGGLLPGVSQSACSSVDSSVFSSGGLLDGLAALTPAEQQAYARAFDAVARRSGDGGGRLDARDLCTATHEALARPGVDDRSRLFIFHLLGAVDGRRDQLDFSAFASLAKDAESACGPIVGMLAWDAVDAMDLIAG